MISAILILLFVYAAVSKLIDFPKFKTDLGKSPILTAYAGWFAIIVPSLEIIISLLIAFEKFQLLGLYVFFSLMVMFTTYIVIILNFSDYVPCSCGGVLQNMSWGQHLIFNVSFTILSIIAILMFPFKEGKKIKMGN